MASSIFEREVESTLGICENCYERTHEIESDWWPNQDDLIKRGHDWDFYDMKGSEREEKFAHLRFHKVKENTEKAYTPFEPSGKSKGRNVCEDCGIIDSGVKFRPLDKGEAISYTQNISERLKEAGISFDEDVLFDCVRGLKKKPFHQNQDEDIFEAAVKVAVRYGAYNDTTTK